MDDICLNCGTVRHGEYCSNCGQNSRDYLRSAYLIVAEVFAEVFDLHGRMFRTLGQLMFRPGHLTAEFSRGRRAQYLSPGRLYLVVSVVFFGALSLAPGARVDLDDLMTDEAELEDVLASLPAPERERVASVLTARGVKLTDHAPETHSAAAPDPDTPGTAIERGMLKGVVRLLEDPQDTWADVVANLPVGMFLMLPLFALLLKSLYPGAYYAQHLVFALHLHSFLFILLTVEALLPPAVTAGAGATEHSVWLTTAVAYLSFAYAYMALRTVHRQSRSRTLMKLVALVCVYSIVLAIGLSAVFAVTVAMS